MRNYTRSTLFLLILALGFQFVAAAGGPTKRGNRLFDQLAYSKALKKYEKALKKDPTNGEALTRMADCYRLLGNSQKAEYWYSKAVKLPKTAPETQLYYAQALMNNEKYDPAVQWFEKYLKEKPGDDVAKRQLWSCKNYNQFMRDSSLYTVKNVSLNTPEADFGPSFYKNTVVYASAKEKSKLLFLWNGRYFLDLYEAPYGGRPELVNPEAVRGKVNTKYHEAITTYTPDGKTMYFTRNNFTRGKLGNDQEGTILLKTYSSQLKEGRKPKWKKVKEFPYNDKEFSMGHPSLSNDGNQLYIVSDKPGGYGGTDLYVCQKKGDGWGEPKNLGSTVNSAGNEMFPWMSPGGTLYYSSDGFEGLGGLDLYRTSASGSNWNKPENLGYPLNSARDDFSLILDEKRGVGFFSSNRIDGQGDDDIYSFTRKQILRAIVVDKKTQEVIDVARVEVNDVSGIYATQYTGEDGKATLGVMPNKDYYLVTSKQGYNDDRQKFSTKNTNLEDDVIIKVELEKLDACEDALVLDGQVLGPNGEPVPGAKIVVEQKPKTIDPDENGHFVLPIQKESDYTVKVEMEDGSPGPEKELTTVGETCDTVPVTLRVGENWDIGKVFYIIYYDFDKHDIRDKDARPELDRVVRFMSRNPRVKVELGSHTDSRGSNAYNMRLSNNRALEAWQYITAKGIEKDRLTYKWYGEKELTNGCKNGVFCTEEDHQLNRRTEFTFMGYIDDPVEVKPKESER